MLNSSTLNQIANVLDHYPVMQARLFGSQAREETNPGSDIDLHIQLEEQAKSYFSLLELAQLKQELEAATGRPVDLITQPLPRLKQRFRERIQDDLQLIYEKKR